VAAAAAAAAAPTGAEVAEDASMADIPTPLRAYVPRKKPVLGRASSSVFEWSSPPRAPRLDSALAVTVAQASSHNREACPLLGGLLLLPELRLAIFGKFSLPALHQLGAVCAVLRLYIRAYISEALPRPIVFGGTRGRGRWRGADGGGTGAPDRCCAEELCWESLSWTPVPSTQSRLRLPPPHADSAAATASWLGAAAAFGAWPTSACIAAARRHMLGARGCAISYVEVAGSPSIVLAGGVTESKSVTSVGALYARRTLSR